MLLLRSLWINCILNRWKHQEYKTSMIIDYTRLTNRFVTRVTLKMSLLEQELIIFLAYLISHQFFTGLALPKCLVLCLMFVDHCLYICAWYVGHCIFCPFAICDFWLTFGNYPNSHCHTTSLSTSTNSTSVLSVRVEK